ncbi:MAG: YfhO family protein, partial [Clostridiales bacterium]|nr:YfhO family protein [Clostridiales bacterium]
MRLNNKIVTKERIRFLLVYSMLFSLCFFFCFQIFFSNYNKTYIFNYDAIDNNYPFFIAVGRWWRLLFKNIFIKHTFEIPMWDMSIGYGGDIITTLGNGFNNFFNPLYIISAFFPSDRSETAFKIVLILQIYLSGLTFNLLASYRKRYSKTAVMIGSMVYAFSSNTYIVFKQLSFGYALVIFPLIVLGIWMIRDKKKPYLFIISVISMFTYSYYFTFMAVIILLVYYVFIVAESLIVSKGKNLRDELKILLKLFLSSVYAGIIGILLILPSIIAITRLDRLDLEYFIPVFRDKAYSKRLFAGFVSVFDGWSDDLLGFPVLALICVFGLFLLFGFKEELKAKILFIIGSVSLFVPYVGHVLNGMSYSTNRWTWAYTLLVSFIITMVFDKLYNAKIWKLAVIIALLIGYECVIIFYFDTKEATQMVPVTVGIAIVLFTMCSRLFSREDYEKIMVGITVLAIAIPGFFYFSPRYTGIMSHLLANGTPYGTVVRSGGKEALYIVDDDSLFRYDTMSGKLKNSSLIMGVAGYDTYNSIYNPYISQFDKDMGFTSTSSPSITDGISTRSDLEALMGTKYMIRNADDLSKTLPYGYSQNIGHYVTEDKATYELYMSGTGSSIVSFFPDSVDESYYDSLSCY